AKSPTPPALLAERVGADGRIRRGGSIDERLARAYLSSRSARTTILRYLAGMAENESHRARQRDALGRAHDFRKIHYRRPWGDIVGAGFRPAPEGHTSFVDRNLRAVVCRNQLLRRQAEKDHASQRIGRHAGIARRHSLH